MGAQLQRPGRASCRVQPGAERWGLKAGYGQQSCTLMHPPALNVTVPVDPAIRAAGFPDLKPDFTVVSTAEPGSPGKVSWLLFCFAHHQQNCQLISYCRIFIAYETE